MSSATLFSAQPANSAAIAPGKMLFDYCFVAIPSAQSTPYHPQFEYEWPYAEVQDATQYGRARQRPSQVYSFWQTREPDQPAELELYVPSPEQSAGPWLIRHSRNPQSIRSLSQGRFSSDGVTIQFPRPHDATGPSFIRVVEGCEETDLPVPDYPYIPQELKSRARVFRTEAYALTVFNESLVGANTAPSTGRSGRYGTQLSVDPALLGYGMGGSSTS